MTNDEIDEVFASNWDEKVPFTGNPEIAREHGLPVAGEMKPQIAGNEEQNGKRDEEESGTDYPLKLRIELLNFLLAQAGCSLEQIKEKRLSTNVAKLYRIILDKGANRLLKENIGKVVYEKKPAGLDEKVKEVNKLLMKINDEWSIKL